jgi:hypothetical protein
MIKPPWVLKEERYQVKFYSWKLVGGILEEWWFEISGDGKVQTSRIAIASKVGAYTGVG